MFIGCEDEVCRISIFSWVRSCCSSAGLFWMQFTLICSILNCLLLGCGLLVAEVSVCGGALSVLLVQVVFCKLLVAEDCV